MKKEKKCGDLLSEIAEELGLMCLSDLRFFEGTACMYEAVAKIPPAKYSCKERNEAVCYIKLIINPPESRQFSSAEEAKNHLLDKTKIFLSSI